MLLWLLLIWATPSLALIGYDCGQGLPNITTISLEEVGECELGDVHTDSQYVDIQLLQKREFEHVLVRTCKITYVEDIVTCKRFDVQRPVAGTNQEKIYNLSPSLCDEMHKFQTLKYHDVMINGLLINATNRYTTTIVGFRDQQGDCEGGHYNHNGVDIKNAVVTHRLKITLQEYLLRARRSKDDLVLPSGTRCSYKVGQCKDVEENTAIWTYTANELCPFREYVLLYEGPGARVSDNASTTRPVVYFANTTANTKFGLARTHSMMVCGYLMYATEHPDLFITEYRREQGFHPEESLETENVLLSAYFNTKLSYFARHVRSQFETLYKDVLFHQCRLERETLKNSLLHIHHRPDLTAMLIMKRPGYIAVPAGEVAHLVPCAEVKCTVRHDVDACTDELPVTCENKTLFMKPITRILSRTATQRDCSSMAPTTFHLQGMWMTLDPKLVRTRDPQLLKPLTTPTWAPKDIEGLLASGIYRLEDLEKFRDLTLAPMDRGTFIEAVRRKLNGEQLPNFSPPMNRLIDPDYIEQVAESRLKKIWFNFVEFGSVSAGIMSIIMIFGALKVLADTVIRGYTLHRVMGFGFHLLAACFGSLTHLITTIATNDTSESSKSDAENVQLDQTTKLTPPPPEYGSDAVMRMEHYLHQAAK